MEGVVTAVRDHLVGSTLISQSGTTLTVEDPDEFGQAGELEIGGEIRTYTVNTAEEIIIASALVGTYAVDTPVRVYPHQTERIALVLEAGSDEELQAVVPHTLHDKLSAGTREDGEIVTCEVVGDELQVVDVKARSPRISGAFIATPHDEVPVTTVAIVLTSTYQPGDEQLVVVPEADSLALVTWSAVVAFTAPVTTAELSLLVDGVQTGPEPRIGQTGAAATNDLFLSASGQAWVAMAAGEEYILEVGARIFSGTDGNAQLLGSKSGGLGYALFAN